MGESFQKVSRCCYVLLKWPYLHASLYMVLTKLFFKVIAKQVAPTNLIESVGKQTAKLTSATSYHNRLLLLRLCESKCGTVNDRISACHFIATDAPIPHNSWENKPAGGCSGHFCFMPSLFIRARVIDLHSSIFGSMKYLPRFPKIE